MADIVASIKFWLTVLLFIVVSNIFGLYVDIGWMKHICGFVDTVVAIFLIWFILEG